MIHLVQLAQVEPSPEIISVSLQQLIMAIVSAIGAIAIAYNTFMVTRAANRAGEAQKIGLENRDKINAVVIHTNSMKDELVKAAFLKGTVEEKVRGIERAEQRAEDRAMDRNEDRIVASEKPVPVDVKSLPEGTAALALEEMPKGALTKAVKKDKL